MFKNLRCHAVGIAASAAFAIAIAGWAAPRFGASLDGPRPLGELHAIAAPAQPTPAGMLMPGMVMPEANPAAPTPPAPPAASASPAAPSPVPAAAPPTTAAPASPPVQPDATASPQPLTAADQVAMQQELEQQGKRFLTALQQGDATALRSMLAARCQATDLVALIARRQAAISAQAGAPIAAITPLTTFVGHFDPVAGEAHTVLQWEAAGQRMTLLSADGWLYEHGEWKNTSC